MVYTYIEQLVTHLNMAFIFSIGQTFDSYSCLEEKVKMFETQNYVKLAKSDCRKIKGVSAKCPEKNFNEDIIYTELKYSCVHGGKAYKCKSKGDRPNQSTAKILYYPGN